MKDIHERAVEMARNHLGENTASGGGESERRMAQKALRSQIGQFNGQGVRRISASFEEEQEERILNVAAYCRVSTDDLAQVTSIELQKDNYAKLIRSNPKWHYAGTYVDDGFSGTNTDHRPAFQLMMKHCREGKIDKIVTKSVSRFARNLLDCMGWIEELQKHDPPIAVFFEQENIDTLDPKSNIILFVLAMVAQEESHMKSEAMLLSLEWRFSRGRFLTPKLLGYDKIAVPDGFGGYRKVLSINEDEARTVRYIYYSFINGKTTEEIAKELTDIRRMTGGKRDGKANTEWSSDRVSALIRNERYCGDVLARKTWTPNYKDHKKKKNNGQKNKYYQADHHEAIVSREVWNAAQKILNSRNNEYVPMRVIRSGAFTGYISMNRKWAGYEASDYYRVSSIVMGITDGDPEFDLSEEHIPERGRRISYDQSISQIARNLTEAEKIIQDEIEAEDSEKPHAANNGFQVASGSMFSQKKEPYVRITKKIIYFSLACELKMNGAENIEILFNPIERVLAVRGCDPGHPNAIKLSERKNKIGAIAMCKVLFEIMDWDVEAAYRIPAVTVTGNGHTALLFDLDNFIGRKNDEEQRSAGIEIAEAPADGPSGIFYSGDTDEPQPIEEIRAMEERLREAQEAERRTFGEAFRDHENDVRFADGDWDITADETVLEKEQYIDPYKIEILEGEMIDEEIKRLERSDQNV